MVRSGGRRKVGILRDTVPKSMNWRILASCGLSIWLAVGAVVSVHGASTSSPPGPPSTAAQITGDPKAWEEIITAYKKLRGLPGWREKVTGQGAGITIREVVPPASSRSLTTTSPGSVKTIIVGQDLRYRTNVRGVSGRWTCLTIPDRALTDPSNAGGVVQATRGSDTTINGTRGRTYTYAWTPPVQTKGRSETGMVTVSIGIQTGLPRRFAATFPSGSQMIDYFDYGTMVRIALPPCG
jgi:hypothetical protein